MAAEVVHPMNAGVCIVKFQPVAHLYNTKTVMAIEHGRLGCASDMRVCSGARSNYLSTSKGRAMVV